MAAQTTLDLNCDMGESYGAWKMGNDEAVLGYVSSANIACGFHGGDPSTLRKTVAAAIKQGVAIGAHPGFQDLAGFGRRNMHISPQEAYDITVYQVAAVAGVARSQGGRLHHVKAHGAFYNMAAKDAKLARAMAQAVRDLDSDLIFYGLAGSAMIQQAQALGLRVASEVFGDRSYQPDGTLTPRTQPDAMITEVSKSVEQILRMVREKVVIATDGTRVPVQPDTLCIHGDQPNAVVFAEGIRKALQDAGISVRTV